MTRRLGRALAAGAMLAACGRDVVVGLDPSTPIDGGGAATDADVDASIDGSTATDAGAGPDGSGASGLTGVARSGSDLFVSGWASANLPTDPASDTWVARMTTAGVETWGAQTDDSAAADVATGVLALGGGAWIVSGSTTTAAGRRGWLRKLDGANAVTWTRSLDSDGGVPANIDIQAIALGAGPSLLVGGNEEGNGQPKDGWVARLDPDGNKTWRVSFHGGQANATKIFAITGTVVDQVLAGGTREMTVDGGLLEVPCILQLNTDGAIWNSSEDFGVTLGKGTLRGIVAEANRDATVCVDVAGAIVVARIGSGFNVVASQTYTDPRGPLTLGACTGTSDGALLVVGSVALATGPEPWSAKHARAPFGPIWQRAIPASGPAHAAAVVADDVGGGYAVGYTSPSPRRWFGAIAP
jgi:hypothetical protein